MTDEAAAGFMTAVILLTIIAVPAMWLTALYSRLSRIERRLNDAEEKQLMDGVLLTSLSDKFLYPKSGR